MTRSRNVSSRLATSFHSFLQSILTLLVLCRVGPSSFQTLSLTSTMTRVSSLITPISLSGVQVIWAQILSLPLVASLRSPTMTTSVMALAGPMMTIPVMTTSAMPQASPIKTRPAQPPPRENQTIAIQPFNRIIRQVRKEDRRRSSGRQLCGTLILEISCLPRLESPTSQIVNARDNDSNLRVDMEDRAMI